MTQYEFDRMHENTKHFHPPSALSTIVMISLVWYFLHESSCRYFWSAICHSIVTTGTNFKP